MLAATLLNLISAVVLAGGWALAVWALHRALGAPYLAQQDRRLSDAGALPDPERLREAVLSGRHAA
jgi:hypothetical protein